jgi:spore germination protein GerM
MMPGSHFAPHRVKVFFTRESSMATSCAGTVRFYRRTTGVDLLHDSIAQLMRGPRSTERRDGAVSLFSRRTSGLLNSVRISDGTAFIDFDDLRSVIPGASASCGGTSLLTELQRTAMQFPSVDEVVFSLEGSRRAFYNWLQMEPPTK